MTDAVTANIATPFSSDMLTLAEVRGTSISQLMVDSAEEAIKDAKIKVE